MDDRDTPYKTPDYEHYSLGSKPKITLNIIDQNIANILNMLNTNPNVTTEQLEYLDSKIKELIKKKHDAYLLPTDKPVSEKRIKFAEGTKMGGKYKRTKRIRKSKSKKSRRH